MTETPTPKPQAAPAAVDVVDVEAPVCADAANQPHHSTYSLLATNQTDMIGHVAYALYKRDKLLYCQRVHERHGRAPTDAEVQGFIDSTHVRLESYRSEAEDLLGVFAAEAFDGQLQEEIARVEGEYRDKLEERRGFWKGVRENVVANLAAALITAGLILIVLLTRENATDHIASVLGYEPKQEQPQSPPSQPQPATPAPAQPTQATPAP